MKTAGNIKFLVLRCGEPTRTYLVSAGRFRVRSGSETTAGNANSAIDVVCAVAYVKAQYEYRMFSL